MKAQGGRFTVCITGPKSRREPLENRLEPTRFGAQNHHCSSQDPHWKTHQIFADRERKRKKKERKGKEKRKEGKKKKERKERKKKREKENRKERKRKNKEIKEKE